MTGPENDPSPSPTDTPPPTSNGNGDARLKLGLLVTLVGWGIFLVAMRPQWFGLERAPGVGLVQLLTLSLGWLIFAAGVYWSIAAMWPKGQPWPLRADIGARLLATGAVLVVLAALADVFGLGSHPWPLKPSFGPWQQAGVLIGQGVGFVGILLMWPPKDNPPPKR